ncbi:unnamed protein product [Adineta ricciae]|uniref:G-protein coupled receptors family 1 profile domain-containing protein n=1 Tax=Adineta ricciae TaxID=249248 RepID=A0A815X1V7_ADIRI|nr:unnamed protein product [Adineta ricciae]CAF1552020.1 unnamed protein product [Adineta ricciae]
MNESINLDFPSSSFTLTIIQTAIFFLTIVFAIAYTTLILVESTLRKNKLNWFTINVCLTSVLFSTIMIMLNIQQLLGVTGNISCQSTAYLVTMIACQLMYSHCVFAISRLLTIVYAHKRIFRSNLCLWGYIIAGWIVAFLLALPYSFTDFLMCSKSEEITFISYYALITILFLPIIIITACNTRTLMFVRHSARRVHAGNTVGQVSHKRDVFLVKLTIGTFIMFIVGWTPSFTIQIFQKTAYIPNIANECFHVLPSIALLGDVLLLIFTNQPVRVLVKNFTNKIFHL